MYPLRLYHFRLMVAASAGAFLFNAPLRAQTSTAADAAPAARQFSGELPDQAGPYRMSVPPNWSGVLILDLDFAIASESPLYKKLYALGYAGAGSTRGAQPERGTAVDNPDRIQRQLAVLALFEERFGKPKRVISLGFSGAGGLAVALLEAAPKQIDGSVGACIITGSIGWFNSKLDAAFAAKTLLAPASTLPLQNIPHELDEPSKSWLGMLTTAQGTPAGRARIALATALGQLPTWSNPKVAEPDKTDLPGVQSAMFDTLASQFSAQIGAQIRVRRDFEESSGGPISWNGGITYSKLFAIGIDPQQRRTILQLYRIAALDVDADLRQLDQSQRESANANAVSAANRLMGVTAHPHKPVLLMHTTGDSLAQPATLEAYTRRAPVALVRTTFVHAAGHCAFSVAENVAAVETVNERLATGHWPDTSSAAMNTRARSLDTSDARFVDLELGKFNRAFYAEDKPPGGR
jgi:dienelactone hydrolase